MYILPYIPNKNVFTQVDIIVDLEPLFICHCSFFSCESMFMAHFALQTKPEREKKKSKCIILDSLNKSSAFSFFYITCGL